MEILIFKSLLYVSSYIPLIIMIYLNAMKNFSFNEVVNVYLINPVFWIVLFLCGLFSFVALMIWLQSMKKESKSHGKKYKLTKLNSHEGEVPSMLG